MKFNIGAKGLLQENNQVLFIEYEIDGVLYYALPGGAIEPNETLADCVVREFWEETQIAIKAEQLLLVNEFINKNPKGVADDWKNGIHQIEIIFKVSRTSPIDTLHKLIKPKADFGMKGIKWLDKKALSSIKYYPDKAVDWFFQDAEIDEITPNMYQMKYQ